MTEDGWALVYDGFDAAEEGLRETLTSTGNGCFCTRGAAEWQDADATHYPGTYAHGVYNRETTILGGRPIFNEDLVNLPNWLVLKLRYDDEETFGLGNVELLDYRHRLDLRTAVVSRDLRFRDRAGRVTRVSSRRFVSMARMHQAGIAWRLEAENWSGRAEILTALDGRVLNQGVDRYRQLEGRHLDPQGPRIFGSDVIALKARTRHSRIEIAQAARTRVFRAGREVEVARTTVQMEDYIQQVLAFDVREGEPVCVEKMVALYTSRDRATSEPLANAGKSATRYPGFDAALADHARAWDELWEVCDIRLPREPRVQFLLRLHIYHLLQTCSRLTVHHDAGVPARGLNGEAYRGHVFWDELYVYPFLNLRLPEITRGLLMYRYRRIGEARAAAEEAGYRGAMYPWQSGSDGEEETQFVHLNPLSGRWEPDLSRNQRHVNAAIFYNVWQYYQATHDLDFLRDHGAEMMLEIARFWSSIAHFNPERDRWEIHGVMGPDEFHEKDPGAARGGLRNNAYTNVMVAWICATARDVLDLLPASRRDALRAKIGLTDDELRTWEELSRKLFVPFHDDGIISQFEGYEALDELDWEDYRERYGNIQRLDRILRAEGDTPDRYKLAKQADVAMLFFLLGQEELAAVLARLGYELAPGAARRTISYYEQRTSHGSTLSHVTHAGVLAAIDPESSWERFKLALESDVGDVQGGTTREGIHLGVMSGTLDLVQRAYAGTTVRDGHLSFNPRLLERMDGLSFPMQFRRTPMRVTLAGGELTVAVLAEGATQPVRVAVGDEVRELAPGDRWTFVVARDGHQRGRARVHGVIFDVDGVLVDSPHERAWRQSLRELMKGPWSGIRDATSYAPERFTSDLYQRIAAGKPRTAGARAVLEHFGVPELDRRVAEYADHKQAMVVALIEAGDFAAFPDALRFLLAVRGAGMKIAAASSSRNAGLMLPRLRLGPHLTVRDVLDADVSGRRFERGKPHPDIFLAAAEELGLRPAECIVVEDAPAGVAAATAGGMGAIGVARDGGFGLLEAEGAGLVVKSLDDVDANQLAEGRLTRRARASAAL
jgi:HAD superfamily hydrolase (TIGR01509 family)